MPITRRALLTTALFAGFVPNSQELALSGEPFPSIPLIGPRTLNELDDSIKAFDIKLKLEDVKWLESGCQLE